MQPAFSNWTQRPKSDVLIVPFTQGKTAHPATKHPLPLLGPVATQDFTGKQAELAWVYPDHLPKNQAKSQKEKRWLLVGLGSKKEMTTETIRQAYATATRACIKKELDHVSILLLDEHAATATAVAEAVALSNYAFDNYKKKKTHLLKRLTLIGTSAAGQNAARVASITCEGITLTRDLINGNADDITPQALTTLARKLSRQFPKLTTTILGKKQLEKEKLGLILAVNQSSPREPALIIMKYKGDPKTTDHTVLVGKGITYDTGGLSLKTSSGMETMKADMGGAATAFGALYATIKHKLKINLTVVIPTTENCIGGKSYKVGDVYKAADGTTVEINNTDAEGRLVLADAIAYSKKKLNPTRIIDFATLTGAVIVALGHDAIGMMGNNKQLKESLHAAATKADEVVVELPLLDSYKRHLKSDIADLKNSGGRAAGSITAGLFLKHFVGKTPWTHFDIAGTAYSPQYLPYNPTRATGAGVRFMIEFLKRK
jgi:leucyl aminopeptidase